MGMKMHPPHAFLFLATVGLIWINAPGIASEEKSDLDALPRAVQKTAKQIVGKSKAEEVENTFENGKRAYEVEFECNGKEMAAVISPEGKLLQTDDRMSVGDTPEKIRIAVLKQFPHGEITHIKSIDVDGTVHFGFLFKTEVTRMPSNSTRMGRFSNHRTENWQEAALLTSGKVLTAPLLFLCLVFAQADNKDIS